MSFSIDFFFHFRFYKFINSSDNTGDLLKYFQNLFRKLNSICVYDSMVIRLHTIQSRSQKLFIFIRRYIDGFYDIFLPPNTQTHTHTQKNPSKFDL